MIWLFNYGNKNMSLQHYAYRAQKFLRNRFFHSIGRDPITLRPLTHRADLECIGARGGWTIPTGLLHAESICYCVGCGEDISFDLGLIDRFGCDVFAFDPTPRAIRHVQAVAGNNARYHFRDVGLWDAPDRLRFYAPTNPRDVSHSLVNLQKTSEYIEVPVDRLSALMTGNGHARLDLLKLDIEGAEYRVLETIFADNIDVGILCVEFDEFWNPLDSGYKARIRRYVDRILAWNYALVDAPGNGNYTFLKSSSLH